MHNRCSKADTNYILGQSLRMFHHQSQQLLQSLLHPQESCSNADRKPVKRWISSQNIKKKIKLDKNITRISRAGQISNIIWKTKVIKIHEFYNPHAYKYSTMHENESVTNHSRFPTQLKNSRIQTSNSIQTKGHVLFKYWVYVCVCVLFVP